MSRVDTPFFSHPVVDYLLMGGLSIAAFAFFAFVRADAVAGQVSQFLVLYLVWAGNAPHFAATCYRLYRSPRTMSQYPYTAFLVPFVVANGVAASLQYPARIAPYFVKLYLLWSPFHYSGQAVGITLLYARRAGFPVTRPVRWMLSTFIYGAFITAAANVESGLTKLTYFGIVYPTLGVPTWIASAGMYVILTSGLALLTLLLFHSLRLRRLPPPILLVPATAHFIWFIPGPRAADFFQLVPFFHGIQYLLIAWYMQLSERGRTEAWPKWRVAAETAFWGVLNLVGGVFLLGVLPKFGAIYSHSDLLLAMPVVIAGVQIHHFFVDGVIWKIRDPRVARCLLGPPRGGEPGGDAAEEFAA